VPSDLLLTVPLYCLPATPGAEDQLPPEGTPIRDLWRGEDHGDFGHV